MWTVGSWAGSYSVFYTVSILESSRENRRLLPSFALTVVPATGPCWPTVVDDGTIRDLSLRGF